MILTADGCDICKNGDCVLLLLAEMIMLIAVYFAAAGAVREFGGPVLNMMSHLRLGPRGGVAWVGGGIAEMCET